MKTAYTILLLALASAAAASPVASMAQATADKTLLNLMMQPSGLTGASDPIITQQCFDKYLPIISHIATEFQTQYTACTTTADQATANLTNEASQNREWFASNATSICNTFQTCNSDTDTLNFFSCYANASTADVTTMYQLSTNATSAATTLKQGLQQIADTRDTCSNEVEHTYVVNTALAYDELNECFANGLPDESTTTEASSTTDASTATT